MFKKFCDNCKKAIKVDYVGVDFYLSSVLKSGRYDFCVGCVKSVSKFLLKAMRKNKPKG